MAVLTLLDLAMRTNSDATVGLVEEILLVAPELRTLPVIPKAGTSYRITRRTGRPHGVFRNANEGVSPGKSTYTQIEVPMFFYDGQMQVDEAVVKADDRNIGDILADEGAGQLQDCYVGMGDQIYRGTTADKKGFKGLMEQIDPTMVIDATGTGATTHTAWAVYESPRDGLHLPIGNMGALSLAEWARQQVSDANSNKYMAWVNNLSFYIGLAAGSAYCLGCVKNITAAKPLTDALGNQLFSKFLIGRKPTRWFVSRDATYYLQNSRSAVGQYPADSGGGAAFAPRPTSLAGVPLVETDSIATLAAW